MYTVSTYLPIGEVSKKFASLREAFKVARATAKTTKSRVYLHKEAANGVVYMDGMHLARRRAGRSSFNGWIKDADLDMTPSV